MNKNNIQFGLAGIFIGLVLIGGILTFFHPTPKIEQSEKMKECINAGGKFMIRDWSLRDDGSEYLSTCEIPEHYIWKISL